ncbi:MAG: ammonia-forming cytochrome c nitrite reductase subunit c552, partial [Coriobacteriales bacterium]|nr:ammonia-forming cytochrome c nitrite reductase subunit c552 [Coriobacteriales bacterium]
MRKVGNKPRFMRWIVLACFCALAFALVACTSTNTGADKKVPVQRDTTPIGEPNSHGIYTADQWKEAYPYEYASYKHGAEINNSDNRGNMLDIYPSLSTIWIGSAFSKFYNEPNDHLHALEDIRATGRTTLANDTLKPTLANCLTCKSADYT